MNLFSSSLNSFHSPFPPRFPPIFRYSKITFLLPSSPSNLPDINILIHSPLYFWWHWRVCTTGPLFMKPTPAEWPVMLYQLLYSPEQSTWEDFTSTTYKEKDGDKGEDRLKRNLSSILAGDLLGTVCCYLHWTGGRRRRMESNAGGGGGASPALKTPR